MAIIHIHPAAVGIIKLSLIFTAFTINETNLVLGGGTDLEAFCNGLADSNYYPESKSCIQRLDDPQGNWEETRQFCKDQNILPSDVRGRLAHLTDSAKASNHTPPAYGDSWIGLKISNVQDNAVYNRDYSWVEGPDGRIGVTCNTVTPNEIEQSDTANKPCVYIKSDGKWKTDTCDKTDTLNYGNTTGCGGSIPYISLYNTTMSRFCWTHEFEYYNQQTDSCFKYYDDPRGTWSFVYDGCAQMFSDPTVRGRLAHIVSPHIEAEFNQTDQDAWIGLRKTNLAAPGGVTTSYAWYDGSDGSQGVSCNAFTPTLMDLNHPDTEQCVYMARGGGQFEDASCDSSKRKICEFVDNSLPNAGDTSGCYGMDLSPPTTTTQKPQTVTTDGAAATNLTTNDPTTTPISTTVAPTTVPATTDSTAGPSTGSNLGGSGTTASSPANSGGSGTTASLSASSGGSGTTASSNSVTSGAPAPTSIPPGVAPVFVKAATLMIHTVIGASACEDVSYPITNSFGTQSACFYLLPTVRSFQQLEKSRLVCQQYGLSVDRRNFGQRVQFKLTAGDQLWIGAKHTAASGITSGWRYTVESNFDAATSRREVFAYLKQPIPDLVVLGKDCGAMTADDYQIFSANCTDLDAPKYPLCMKSTHEASYVQIPGRQLASHRRTEATVLTLASDWCQQEHGCLSFEFDSKTGQCTLDTVNPNSESFALESTTDPEIAVFYQID